MNAHPREHQARLRRPPRRRPQGPQQAPRIPHRARFAAVYTTLAPTRVGAQLDLFTGVAGAPTFATYSGGAAPWHGISVFQDSGPAALKTGVIPFAVTESLAVAADYPLALVGGEEAPCESTTNARSSTIPRV